MLARVIGWAVSTVSPTAFAAKWAMGRARPEEIAWGLKTGECCDGAPAGLGDDPFITNLARQEDFTAYEEGSPVHPSWPAMHSAASAASLYLGVVLDLSAEDLLEARRVDFCVASFRSIAGVHYDSDNRAGLSIGHGIVEATLPAMLESVYGNGNGAVANATKAKMAKINKGFSCERSPNEDSDPADERRLTHTSISLSHAQGRTGSGGSKACERERKEEEERETQKHKKDNVRCSLYQLN